MFNLSSIIIAKNEEANIGRCIKSQLDCIDEIIVLIDKDSTDKTIEIVKSFSNVKHEFAEWEGYSKTKQRAVSLASNNWVLWIDADEALTDQLRNELLELKNSTPDYSAYSIPRKANFLGRWILHSGWYPGRVVRLFNKNKARFSDHQVHEQLIVNGEIGDLKSDLEHYTDPNIFHYFEKFNNYTSIAAKELNTNNKSFSVLDLILRPIVIFVKMYIVKLGFLDGIQGFILAVFSSAYVFTKYAKLWEINFKGNK
jgi:glycosyltransferase involved in cell wall biosynthesis